jgi:hypothetical protein
MQQLAVLLKSEAMKNVAVGLGIAVLVPLAVRVLAPVLRPLARSTLKAGILAYEKGRETVAELGEVVDDLVAEVQEELQEAREREAELIEADANLDQNLADSSEKR